MREMSPLRGRPIAAPAGETPSSWAVYEGRGFRIGAVRCSHSHPRWTRVNDIPGDPVLVFPRHAVAIEPMRGGGGVLDSNERYARRCMSDAGDRSEWLAFREELLHRLAPHLDPSDLGGPRLPRVFGVEPRAMALLRQAFRHVLLDEAPEELLVEEAVCHLLDSLRERRRDGASRRGVTTAAHRRLVDDLRILLAQSFAEPTGLTELATALGVTAPHLCRVFHSLTGGTIHALRDQLRLAAALDQLEDGVKDLTSLALDLGYSSHSHFTANFGRALSRSPSAMRAALTRGCLDGPDRVARPAPG